MLGYSDSDVINKLTPADISDVQEFIVRAQGLSIEFNTNISPGLRLWFTKLNTVLKIFMN
jgi:hypothetical protein